MFRRSLVSSVLFTGVAVSSSRRAMASSSTGFYDLTANNIKGQEFPFANLRGQVVLVVNVASECGFTPQYEGLEALYKKYKDQGLVIVGFPCNQFGGQEPGDEEQIQNFCRKNFGVTFPLMQKVEVNGDNVHPVYQYLKEQKPGVMGLTRIKWNFEKFLVDRNGTVVERFSSLATPESLDASVAKLISEGAAPAEQKASE